jgi:catechol 2,3-dioxygenase
VTRTKLTEKTEKTTTEAPVMPPETRIGHVHLKVADIDRSLHFYCDILGFDVVARYGDQIAFISAGGYHHHVGLNTFESKGGTPPPPGHTGLYHTAIVFPSRNALAEAVKRLDEHKWPLTGSSDHGVSEAVYLDDPDGNGVELYWDRPRDEWPRAEDGSVTMYIRPLDVRGLLAELD